VADRTLVIIKPDAIERGLAGEILSRFERKGLRVVAMRLVTIDVAVASLHYEEHQGKPFYDDLIDFIGRSPSITMVLEGPEDTWKVVRTLMGATNPRESAPGTIRGDYGILLTENLVHGSDGPESAAREVAIFFPELG
jgi:nucleoside-diphosphate kinase